MNNVDLARHAEIIYISDSIISVSVFVCRLVTCMTKVELLATMSSYLQRNGDQGTKYSKTHSHVMLGR